MGYGGHAGELGRSPPSPKSAADAAAGRRTRDRRAYARPPGGRVGQAAAFSFFSNKNLAIGEGGMVTTADDELAARVRLLRSHGMTSLSWDRHRGHARVTTGGARLQLPARRAAGGAGLRRLEARRRERAGRGLDAAYRERLDTIVACGSPPRPGATSAHHIFTIVLDEAASRCVPPTDRRTGRPDERPLSAVHRFSIYFRGDGDLPLTEAYAERTLTLPLFGHMTVAQQDLVRIGHRRLLYRRA